MIRSKRQIKRSAAGPARPALPCGDLRFPPSFRVAARAVGAYSAPPHSLPFESLGKACPRAIRLSRSKKSTAKPPSQPSKRSLRESRAGTAGARRSRARSARGPQTLCVIYVTRAASRARRQPFPDEKLSGGFPGRTRVSEPRPARDSDRTPRAPSPLRGRSVRGGACLEGSLCGRIMVRHARSIEGSLFGDPSTGPKRGPKRGSLFGDPQYWTKEVLFAPASLAAS